MTFDGVPGPAPLEDWFKIGLNGETITIYVNPPGGEAWSVEINWSDIERVCYETTGFMYSDDIYLFVKGRKESYRIPVDADGGMKLWLDIIDRKLFDAELAITVATADEGTVNCWPPVEE